jgi:adenylosuccinate synthase
MIVRYNGGPQNAHNVITPDGRHHTFSQFGSGSFVSGVHTYASEHMLIDPLGMLEEAKVLAAAGVPDILDRLWIHPEAVIITPYQQALNRLTEIARGKDAHGSCGIGVGQARVDSILYPDNVLRARHLFSRNETLAKLHFIEQLHIGEARELCDKILARPDYNEWMQSELLHAFGWYDGDLSCGYLWRDYADFPRTTILRSPESYSRLLDFHNTVIFEGSQGVLLDEDMGNFYPNVTWTDTTFNNAYELIQRAKILPTEITRIGCIRPYATRHGAGSFPGECSALTELLPESHNATGQFQGAFRTGWLDLDLLRLSLGYLGGVDQIALSCMDRLTEVPALHVMTKGGFRRCFVNPSHLDVQGMFIDWLQTALDTPVSILGYGPSAADRQERLTYLNEKAA